MTDVASYSRAPRRFDWRVLSLRFAQRGPVRCFQIAAGSVIVAVGLSCLLLQLPAHQWFSDYWEHAEAIRSFATNPLRPPNPHYATMDADRYLIPPFLLLGLAVRHLGMSLFGALGLFGIFNIALFVYAVGRFARIYFADVWARLAALLVFLFAWGEPWVWTGCYDLRALFYNAYYPSLFVFGLTFATWALAIRAIRCDEISGSTVLAIAALTAVMVISHQLTAAFAIGGIGLFLLFEPLAGWRVRSAIALAVACGILASCLWPYFNPITLAVHASGVQIHDGHQDFYTPHRVLLLLGPTLLGFYGMARMYGRTRRLTLIVGFATIFAVYLYGGLIDHPITHRLLTFFTVFLQLGLIWEILERQKRRAGSDAINAKLLLVALSWVVIQTGLAAGDFFRFGLEQIAHRSFGAFPNQPVVSTMRALSPHIPEDAIAFATYSPALVLPAFKGKTVSRPRAEQLIDDGEERRADDARFFARDTTAAGRESLIAKYHVTHVLYREGDISADVARALRSLGPVIATAGDIVVISVGTYPQ